MAAIAELQLVTSKMPVAVAHCTRDLRYEWVSSRLAEWIQRPVEQIVGKKIQDVLGTEAFLKLLPYFEKADCFSDRVRNPTRRQGNQEHGRERSPHFANVAGRQTERQ